ncbi:MAG: methyltransferase [bacterium]|nr:methyltransferase [bacterium]
MLTISLTRHPHARKELLLEKQLRVVSRSGLNPTELALIQRLPSLQVNVSGKLTAPLFLGGRTGALAMALWLTRGKDLQGPCRVHTFDAHTQKILQRNLDENRAPSSLFSVETTLAVETFAVESNLVFWQMTKGDGTAERDLDTLERLLCPSTVGPRQILVAADELNETFLKRFKKHCSHVTVRREGTISLLVGVVTSPLSNEDRASRRATFEVSIKGHDPLTLVTYPGCFCHRRADMGGLALTEVVAENVGFEKGDRVMDMGCGCGMDGILLAMAFPEKKLRIDYQDSNAAAILSTQENLVAYPHEAHVIFSAEGEGKPKSYDLFLANPPYFGDWRIAEFFVQTAAKLLKKGGLIAFVSKREGKPTELLEAAGFTLLNTFQRRGYTILLAVL